MRNAIPLYSRSGVHGLLKLSCLRGEAERIPLLVKHCSYREDRRLKQKNLGCFTTFQQSSLDVI